MRAIRLAHACIALVWLAGTLAHAETRLFFGDTHLHTSWSPDAYLLQNRSADPDTAYRYAKGQPVVHPYHRARIQIETPLDFLVVSDHGEYMGVIPLILKNDPRVSGSETAKRFRQLAAEGKEREAFGILIGQVNAGVADPDLVSEEITSSVWAQIMEAGERHNDPGTFTSFLGWEWSSTPDGANLHRVVLFKEGETVGRKFLPYTSLDSSRPEDLWAWLEATSSETGASFLAIPHNSNISKGLMFPTTDSDGQPISAELARTRMRWEPVAEVTQIKGDSETHPALSPTDEFADFESFQHVIDVNADGAGATTDPGDYVRGALERGLEIGAQTGVNPYQLGMIGSTDSHTGMASAEEDNFHGKFGLDSTPKTSLTIDLMPGGVTGASMSASGLAAVWAEENTRESLFDAFQRREVYATTGPRLRVRFFGGPAFTAADASADDIAARGYAGGVPMGGELGALAGPPTFLIQAAKDPVGANLDRIQIVKGWLDTDGKAQERIFDVALSDDRAPGADGKAPAVGNTVDVATGTYTNTIGDVQLETAWSDPEFDPARPSFYYARVLQIPTPRHTLLDAIALDMDVAETGHPATIQERAYTSPIWYAP